MKKVLGVVGIWVVLALAGLAADQLATVRFVVLKDHNGKPVRNCAVVMHPIAKSGKISRNGIQLKTDADGKTMYDGVPYGKLAIQVIAQGYQTTGETYDVNKPEMEITIRIKRPTEQYSIYKDERGAEEKDKDKDKKPE
jgi:hypothetical protein